MTWGNVILSARPEPLTLAPVRTAIVVVDLQNGYASPRGYRDLRGRSIEGADRVIANTNRIVAAARQAGATILFLQNGWDANARSGGGPGSPNWHKSNPLKLMRERPELRGKILTEGTWDYDFVDGLDVREGDLVVPKPRYSGFVATNLDLLLRERDIRTIVFTGIASNVCIESTLRDAYFYEYFCVFVEDATQHSGPDFIQDAVIYNVETFLGWVANTDAVCAAFS